MKMITLSSLLGLFIGAAVAVVLGVIYSLDPGPDAIASRELVMFIWACLLCPLGLLAGFIVGAFIHETWPAKPPGDST
jgi:hypothetical protein